MAKSSQKKNKRQPAATVPPATVTPETGQAADDTRAVTAAWDILLSPRAWYIACGAIMLVALALRVYDLNLKPPHHDEGVNGFFLVDLYRNGNYRYQPENYHGPTLYYFALAVSALGGVLFGKEAGLSTFSVRLTVALFGLGTVWLIFALRKHLGTVATLTAAALLAVSPGMVYISRYFIHEMLFAFFTVGMVVAALHYYDAPAPDKGKREFGYWAAVAGILLAVFTYYATLRPDSFKLLLACTLLNLVACVATLYYYEGPRTWALIFGVVCAALLFATKETAFISVGVLLIAFGAMLVYLKYLQPALFGASWRVSAASEKITARLGWTPERALLLTAVSAGLFLFVGILFYSSFFSNPAGVSGAVAALKVWQQTGNRDHSGNPIYQYLKWLWAEEGALLLLSGLGVLIAFFWQRTRRFAVFAALWAVGITAAYSLIPYKTPWLAINFLPPMALAAGWGLGQIYGDGRRTHARYLALALGVIALGWGLFQTYRLNFVEYDNDQYVYVYAHSRRALNDLTTKVDAAVARSPIGKETEIAILSPDYWPLPWSFRNYPHAGFFGNIVETTAPIVIGRVDQLNELQTKFGANYKYYGAFDLRPGVVLILFIKNDIAP